VEVRGVDPLAHGEGVGLSRIDASDVGHSSMMFDQSRLYR
jgi:hypothetical protein